MSILFVLAQAAATAAATAAPAPAEQGVTSYRPAFFAAQQPANAEEMIERLPGFTLDTGSTVRGFEDAAGNVLINGQRPATKTDALDEVLRRIPASEVERIDVIRGGAPGIDMQGKAVVANVIRKDGAGLHGVIAFAVNHMVDDDRTAPQVRLEANGGRGGRAWEGSLRAFGYVDDGTGNGAMRRSDGAGGQLLSADLDSKAGGKQEIAAGAVETPLFGGGLRVNGRLFWDDFDFTETDDIRLPSPAFQHDDYKQDKFDTEIGGRYGRSFGPSDRFEGVALRQTHRLRYNERFDAPGENTRFHLANDTSESILRGVYKHSQSDRLSWEAGAEGAFNVLDAETDFSENGHATPLPAANVHVEEKRGEAFAKLTWRPLAPLTLEADLAEEGSTITASGDANLSKSLYFTKPRVALTWAIDRNTQVRLRYERVVGQLDFNFGSDHVFDQSDYQIPHRAIDANTAYADSLKNGSYDAGIDATATHSIGPGGAHVFTITMPSGGTNFGGVCSYFDTNTRFTLPAGIVQLPATPGSYDVEFAALSVDPDTGDATDNAGLPPIAYARTEPIHVPEAAHALASLAAIASLAALHRRRA